MKANADNMLSLSKQTGGVLFNKSIAPQSCKNLLECVKSLKANDYLFVHLTSVCTVKKKGKIQKKLTR